MSLAGVSIALVPVGNPGNANDPATGYGRVDYAYNVGKYEVTAGEYTAFLNAVASVDTNGLYNTNMWYTPLGCMIQRSGSNGSYTYSVAADYANRPVNFVSFWDACRFANWLQNGQKTGAQDASTTEDGTYTLTPTGIANNTVTRNTGCSWALTGEDEWYKAAFYNPASGSYYLYPTSSNTAPGRDMSDVPGNNANYNGMPNSPIQSPYYTTLVGEFQNSASPYGTFDQCGNLLEWTDVIISSSRGIRGGSFVDPEIVLRSNRRGGYGPSYDVFAIGFRVSQVPEPISVAVFDLGIMGMLLRRRGAGK
jgi:formylglycine-generating enzyme required for sulfatase activity